MDEASRAASAFTRLRRPRALTPDEERIALHLASGLGPEVAAQIDAGAVTGECRCGCSSVRLATRRTASPQDGGHLGEDSEHVSASAVGQRADGRDVDVTLHLVNGRIAELEVFNAVLGEGSAVDLSGITGITAPQID